MIRTTLLHCLLPVKARNVVNATYLIPSDPLACFLIASKSTKKPAKKIGFIYESSSNRWTCYDN